jgi:hemerythrin
MEATPAPRDVPTTLLCGMRSFVVLTAGGARARRRVRGSRAIAGGCEKPAQEDGMERDKIDEHALGGVAEMEREHALEIQMVRELQAALAAGNQAAAEPLFDRLEEFTNAHFLAEQLLMRLHAYPAFEGHQQEHDRLIAELRDLRRTLGSAEPAAPAAAVARLERWLYAHMQSADSALADFLGQPGAPEPG